MQVRAIRNGDVVLPGGAVKAVFIGQTYTLPEGSIGLGDVYELVAPEVKAQEPVSDKAVEPVSDKAVEGPRGNRRVQR